MGLVGQKIGDGQADFLVSTLTDGRWTGRCGFSW